MSEQLTFGSLFAGIGGFDLGFERAGMRCAWQVEKCKNRREVLKRNWPNVRRLKDVTEVGKHNLESVGVICGGFPCQDISIAGLRLGLAGSRSGLWFEFLRIITEIKPKWVVIENVTGLLSSNKGKDMGTILWSLGECGYGFAYRVFDAQFFGVPQSRRRVFIVASLGTDSAAKVLFERQSSPWDNPPSRKAEENITAWACKLAQTNGNGIGITPKLLHTLDGTGGDAIARCYTTREGLRNDPETETILPVCYSPFGHYDYKKADRLATLQANPRQFSGDEHLLETKTGFIGARRLMPIECERAQGFLDNHTAGFSDTERYKQIGDAVVSSIAEWIGKRINKIESGE